MKYVERILAALRSSDERTRIVAKNIAGSFAIQGAALVLALFTLPAYIRFFDNQETLGVWFTILSVLNWILNLDLGLGNGLRNRLVAALSANDMVAARRYISSAYVMIFGVVSVIGAGVGWGFHFVDWNGVLGIGRQSLDPAALTAAVTITAVGILVQFALRLVVSILYAIQKSAVTGLLNLVTTAGMLLVVTTADGGSNADRLLLLAKTSVVAVNLPLVVATLLVFGTTLRSCSPRLRFFDRASALDVAKVGAIFFVLQVMFMLIANTDPFLISQLAGPAQVVDYQIYSRFFLLVSTIFTLALTPVWSAVTQASATGDYRWIAVLYLRMKRMAYLAGFGLALLCWLLPWIIHLWLRKQAIDIDIRYSLVFAALAGALIWTGVLSSVANGTGRLRVQLFALVAGVLVKVPAALLLVKTTHSWVGVVAASVVAFLPYSILQPFWIGRYIEDARDDVRSSTSD